MTPGGEDGAGAARPDGATELEAALLDVLERAERGGDVSSEWLRRAHPERWRDLDDLLRLHLRLVAGRPAHGVLGAYRVRRRLGQGGMGSVFLAEVEREHAGLAPGTRVALKVVHPHLAARPRFVERTLREARLGRRVRHENVVRTLDFGAEEHEDGGRTVFLVTEYVEGRNLRGLLEELGQVPEDLCRHVAREVLRGLAAIHAAGAVHRDLKPENVLLAAGDRVRVMDLGAARPLGDAESISEPGEFLGSFLYAAPEQVLQPGAQLDGRTDLFALGVLLHELAAGAHPFRGGPPAFSATTPRVGRHVTPFFEAFVATLLAPLPAGRFPSAEAALEALDAGERSAWWRRVRRAGDGAVPMRGEPGLVGRERELDRLVAAFDEAADGRGGSVLVEGEAGIGKTRLVDAALERIAARGAVHVLRAGHGPEDGAGAESAVVAALREVFDGEDGLPALERHLAHLPGLLAPLAARLLPGRCAAAPLEAGALRDGLAAVVASMARERPVVWVVEDLHFASREHVDLAAGVAARLAGERVLVVLTARPAASLADLRPHHRVQVPRLGADHLRRLLAERLGGADAAERLLPVVLRRSDGNPFFALEILRHLRDSRLLAPTAAGGWELSPGAEDAPVPATLTALVERRLAGLEAPDRHLLELAACAGAVFDVELVAEAAGSAAADVLRRFARLERTRRLVVSAGARRAFDHHLVAEALVAGLAPERAAELHASLGAALERRAPKGPLRTPGTELRICDHFLRAGDGPRAAPYVEGALERLAAGCRAAEAVALADRALGVPGAVPRDLRARVLVGRAVFLEVMCRREEELRDLDEALRLTEELGQRAMAARALYERARCLLRMGRPEEAAETAARALEESRAADELECEELAHQASGAALAALARYDEALAHHREQLRLAVESGDPLRRADAEVAIGNVLEHAGDRPGALEHHLRGLALVRSVPTPPPFPGNLRLRTGALLCACGRADEARPLFEEQLRLSRRVGDRFGEAWAELELGEALEREGRAEEAVAMTRRGAESAERAGDAILRATAPRRLGLQLGRAGRLGDALEELERAVRVSRELAFGPGVLQSEVGRALLCSDAGAHAEAERAAAAAEACAAGLPQRRARLLATWARGAVANEGRGDPELLAEAVELARAERDGALAAHALLRLGVARLAEGDEAGGRAALREALVAGREARSLTVRAPAAAALAALGELSPEAAVAEGPPRGAGLPLAVRVAVEHDLWLATGDPAHLREAGRHLDGLLAGAPPHLREGVAARPLHRRVAESLASGQG